MQVISVYWPCILRTCWIHWLTLVIFWKFLLDFLCTVSRHLQTVIILLPFIWYGFLLFFFPSLIAIVRISKIMLNNSGESGHSCPIPSLRGNAFSFSPLTITFAVFFSYTAFTQLMKVPSMPIFWSVFIINGCWILSKAFSVFMEIIIWFYSFKLLIQCITLIDLHILKNPCIPGINPTWSWCMRFSVCCWILFARILLRIFASMFISNIGL